MVMEAPSFIIVFRESLEAALVISIIATYLAKVGKRKYNRYVWYGTLGAVAASIGLAAVIFLLYSGLSGVGAQLFEGLASLTATAVLTSMIIWMARNAHKIKGELERKIDVAITGGQIIAIALLAFIVVFREGLETVLFLTALIPQDISGTLLGTAGGVASVIGLSALVWRGIYRLNLRKFFIVTSVILVVFAAGLTGYGIHELNEAYEDAAIGVPGVVDHVWDVNPPQNSDGSYPLLHERGAVGLVLKGLLGYNGNPSLTEVLAYAGYWLVLGVYLMRSFGPLYGLKLPQLVNMRREEKLTQTPK